MSEIQRYEGIHGHMRSKKGRLVLFTDHEAAMNRLTHYMNEQIARKQREIETHTAALAERNKRIGELNDIAYAWQVTADDLAETVVELRAELATCRDALEKIRVDSGNRPGHEGWNYYCKRLHTIHMIAHNALKEAEDASA